MSTHRRLFQVFSIVVIVTMLFSGFSMPAASAQGPDGIELQVNPRTGKVSFIGPENGQLVAAADALGTGVRSQDPAMALARRFGPEFGLQDAERDLSQVKESRSENGRITTRYQQKYQGIPVIGGELIVNTNVNGDLYSMNGEVSPNLSLSTQPTIDSAQARETALRAMAKWYQKAPEEFTASEPELWIYDESLLLPSTRPAELVWRMEVTAVDHRLPVRELVLINALRGSISLHFNQIDTAWSLEGNSGIAQDPDPTTTALQTETPLSTETSVPAETMIVTETPIPTETSIPAETPEATATTLPTVTPIHTEEVSTPDTPITNLTLAGTTWYVSTTGNDDNSCSISTSPCLTLDGAITKAAAGDIIRVESGTYTGTAGNVVTISKGITLSGGWNNTFTVQNGSSIIDGGGVRNGILINSSGSTVVVEYFVIQNSYTGHDSGGIYLYGANFTLKNSSVINNRAGSRGAGIFMIAGASLSLLNSTVSGNNAVWSGGGIYVANGTITINNSTIAYNTSSGTGGGLVEESGTISIKNSILAKNTAATNGPDCSGSISSSDHTIFGTTAGCTVTSGSGDKFNVDPLISSSLTGTLPLHRLQPISPAINAGDNSTCLSIDQRGGARPHGSACDMGASEFGTETGMFVASGSDQSADPGATFALPLIVYLLDSSGNPVSGATVTFTAPSSGASGTFANSGTRITTAVTDNNGYARSAVFTANNQLGGYAVVATVAGSASSAVFHLRNSTADYYVSPGGSDSSSCTLPTSPCKTINGAINKAINGDTIYIAAGIYTHTDALNHVVYINGKSLSLYGGWNPAFTAQTGFTIVDGEKQYGGFSIWGDSGKTVTLDHFHVRNGDDGGVYLSSPNLIITNSAVYNNSRIGYTRNGGGIYIHSGNLTARNVTFSNNITSGQGGAIYAYVGSYTLNNVTITNNTAGSGGGLVGGNAGQPITRTVKNSILSGNKAQRGPNCSSEFPGMDHTLIGDTSDCTVPAGNGNLLNLDPKLGMFIEELGYQPLFSDSPAINAGLNCFGTADQRGVPRVGACDLGAYEFDPVGPAATIVLAQGNHQRAAPTFPFVLPLYVAVLDDNGSPVSGQSVTFTSPSSGASALFTANGTKSLTVTTGADGIAIAEIKANQLSGSYTVTASASVGSVSFNLENAAWYVSSSGNDLNSCSSPAQACATVNGAIDKAASGETILVASGTYTGSDTQVVRIAKSVTLEGGWNTAFTAQNGFSILDGQMTRRGIYIDEYVTTTIRRFTIQNGNAYWGGGVLSDGTLVTMDHTIVTDSIAETNGGGIYSAGTLVLNESLISSNRARGSGGGIKSEHLIATNSAIFNNVADQAGGGILANGNINLRNVTVSNNSADDGGGVYAAGAGDTSAALNNVTISTNKAKAAGGGLLVSEFVNVTMQNSILTHNSGTTSPDCGGSVISQGHNIIKSISGCTITAQNGDQFNVDPQVGIFLPDPGVLPLLVGSPAIDRGNPAACLPTDQRGIARVGTCDIGAYEYTGPLPPANIILVGGDKQRTPSNFDFTAPLQVGIIDANGSPVSGVNVTFTSPASGPGGTFQNGSRTIALTTGAHGVATTTIRANSILGSYSVIASTAVGSKTFTLENVAWYVSPSGNDGNDCSSPVTACATIQAAVDKALENDTVFVASGIYRDTDEAVLSLNKDIILSGGWNASFTAQDGYSSIHGEEMRSGVLVSTEATATLQRFIVEHSRNDAIQRGAIANDGTLTLIDCEIRYNSTAYWAGGIMNRGKLTIRDSFVRYNAGDRGGGIYNQGVLLVTNTAITDNDAGEGAGIYNTSFNGPGSATLNGVLIDRNRAGGDGGGIHNEATLTVSNTSIMRNSAGWRGGGMINHGTATMNNVSVAGNTGVDGGGVWNGGNITWNNSTISVNTSLKGGGIFVSEDYGSARLRNTILAGNSASKSGPDCSGKLLSSGNNILGNTNACAMSTASGDRVNLNPQLGTFLPTEGYLPLLPTSPAIDAGNPATCRPTDQRGIARPQGSKCDIGAYEYKVPGPLVRIEVVGGSDQLTLFNTAFRRPLQIVALDANGSPVSGVSVRFEAPASSPSGKFADTGTNTTVLATNNGGIAQPAPFTADNTMGTYNVVASTAGVSSKHLSLHNGPWLVVPASNGGRDAYDCMNPGTACASLAGILRKDAFQEGDPVWMAVGAYGSASDGAVIDIDRAVNVYGGWNTNFTEQIGTSVIRDTLKVERVSNMELHRLTVQNTGDAGIRSAGTLTLQDSTIRNNQTGIVNSGQLTIIKSTITQNGDNVIGNSYGAVYNEGDFGSPEPDPGVTILDSTITQNKGDTVGGVTNYWSHTQPIRIQNSIIAGNISLYGSGYSQDCSGEFISDGYNIIGKMDDSQCQARWQATDRVGTHRNPINPMLDTLRNLGNNVWIHPLKLGSPAIDAGPWNCSPLDQRGIPRPQGGSCDIGAFEYVSQHNTAGLLLTTYSAGNSLNPAKTKICDQTDLACISGDAHAKAAHKYAAGAYNFYKNAHNRNSLDHQGIEILSSVHYGSNYPNAFWNGHMMVFGDKYGYPLADDVVAHEFTHGVTQYESNLFYYYQSGAINESFSDLWGEYYDQTNGLGDDSASVKWLIGENVSGQGAIRSMSNPPAYQDPDKMSSSLYYEGDQDSGGVHTNSGVNNKAVFLMVRGGTFNGKTVTALGWVKTAAIYYEVNTNLLSSGADYSDLYYALQQACKSLIGQKGITTGDCREVKDAIDAVEMNVQPAPKFNPHAPLCTVTGTVPRVIFADDFETNTKKWTFNNGTYRRWQWDSPYGPYAQSGNHSLYADDYPDEITDTRARLAALTLPGNAYLHFAQAYDFERGSLTGTPPFYNLDGGVLEYSINNGATWVDAGSLIDFNGYKGKVFNGYGNPLKGRSAFVGSSHGYISTRLNLASLAGKKVTFRWRMGLDEGGYAWGWWLDNIKIYTCGVPQPGAFNKTSPSNNGTDIALSTTLSWSTSLDAISYQYCYDIIDDNQCNRTWNTTKNTSVGISNLGTDTTYYWQVRAINVGGTIYADDQSWSSFAITSTLPVGATRMETFIGTTQQGAYTLGSGQGRQESYSGVDNGPVKLESTNAVPMLGAERLIYKVGGVPTSFSEMLAMPNVQLDTIYYLPWYNSKTLNTQLRFANPGGTDATVTVTIGTVEMEPFPLPAGVSLRKSFANIDAGPVKIESDIPIVAAERVIYNVNGVDASFTEMMALPNKQLEKVYWLPWYNNKTLDTQLRFANLSDAPATVTVTIAGTPVSGSPFTLDPGASLRKSFANIDAGPVKIESDVNIVVSERVIYKVNGVPVSFSEMMAFPNNQLDTLYWLPWYNSKTLDTQLRFANTGGADATVTVTIGGVDMGTFTLPAGASLRKSFPGIDSGPVKIETDGTIAVSERVLYKVNGVDTSFSEWMALPNSLLDTLYWLPWYNNKDLDSQLRFGVP